MRYKILLLAALAAFVACNNPLNPDDPENPEENPENPNNPGNGGSGKTPGIYAEGANSTYKDQPEYHVSRYERTLKVPVKCSYSAWEWEVNSGTWLRIDKRVKDTLYVGVGRNYEFSNRRGSITVRYGTEQGQSTTFYVYQDKWIQSAFLDNEPWEDKEVPVDLGLSVYWGSVNIGATSPERTGAYFAWGDTRIRYSFTWDNYIYAGKSVLKVTKYCNDSKYGPKDDKRQLDPSDDAAVRYLGGKWRMPTSKECSDLADNCIVSTETVNGNKVFVVTSKINGNCIIIPDALVVDHEGVGRIFTYIWSSSLYGKDPLDAWYLEFLSTSAKLGYQSLSRWMGVPIRPVMDKK